MAFDSELGGENSNSLASVEEAVEIAGDLPQTDGVVAWLSLELAGQQQTLVASSMTMQGLRWKGKLCNEKQNLCFPRLIETGGVYAYCEKIPYEVKVATTYLAAFIGESGGYTAIGEEGGPQQTVGTNPFPGLSPDDLQGYDEVNLGRGAIQLKLKKPEANAINYIPPFALNLIARFAILSSSVNSSEFSRSPEYGAAPAWRGHSGRGVVVIDDKVWPRTGGWASNPL